MGKKKELYNLSRFTLHLSFRLFLICLLVYLLAFFSGGLLGCASPRSSPIFSIPYDEQASRGIVQYRCNGELDQAQGLAVCEERSPARAVFNVKIPPLPGRAIFSNGLTKSVQDFNNYGEEGFWFFKKAKIQDTWVSLDLNQFADFGDWPVVVSVVGRSDKVGVIQNSIVFYGRICDDVKIPCSTLEVKYDCVGHLKTTGVGKIGKCQRLSGSSQDLLVSLRGATSGGVVYFSMPQAGILESRPVRTEEIGSYLRYTIPNLPSGPSLLGIRLSYYEGEKLVTKDTRILFLGIDPKWTGTDKPQILKENNKARILRPFAADLIEASIYEGKQPLKKWISHDEKIKDVDWPLDSQKLCAFSYSRDSSDLQYQCLNSQGIEVEL